MQETPHHPAHNLCRQRLAEVAQLLWWQGSDGLRQRGEARDLVGHGVEDELVAERPHSPQGRLEVVLGDGMLSLDLQVPNASFERLKLCDELVCPFYAHSVEGGEVVATRNDAHSLQHLLVPVVEARPLRSCKVDQSKLLTVAIVVHFEENTFAAIGHEVRVLCDDGSDVVGSREEGELCVSLVRSDNMLDTCLSKCADKLVRYAGCDVKSLLKVFGGGRAARLSEHGHCHVHVLPPREIPRGFDELLRRQLGPVENNDRDDAIRQQELDFGHAPIHQLGGGLLQAQLLAACVSATVKPGVAVDSHFRTREITDMNMVDH